MQWVCEVNTDVFSSDVAGEWVFLLPGVREAMAANSGREAEGNTERAHVWTRQTAQGHRNQEPRRPGVR